MITLEGYLVVGAVLFVLGMIGFMTRRNLIVMFLCAELMLQGVALNFVAFAKYQGNLHGQVFTLFIITVAACEAALALAMILLLYRTSKSLDVSLWQELREAGQPQTTDEEAFPAPPPEPALPTLPVAGREPQRVREESYV